MNEENKDIFESEETEHKKYMYVPDEELVGDKLKGTSFDTETDEDEKPEKAKSDNKFKAFFVKSGLLIKKVIPKKQDNVKTIIIKCVCIVAALAILVGIPVGINSAVVYLRGNRINKAARNIYELNRDNYSYNQDGQFSKFDELKRLNPDIVGWISIENTDVDNPVYQHTDNEYYISHDMNRDNNAYGALFLDFRCNIDPKAKTQNQIIYGHNMRYGAMFGTLKEYRNLEFYQNNPVIKLDTLYESCNYKIVAMMITNTTSDDTFGYDFSPYRCVFSSQGDFLDWIKHCRERSLINTEIDVQSQDEVITLSTCCYDFTDARFVIVARKVREGEDVTVDTSAATVNGNPLYSKEYYEKKKLPIPTVQ